MCQFGHSPVSMEIYNCTSSIGRTMSQHLLTGSCLCKRVKYSVAAELQQFYFCHCEQCRKVTGSAFASNIQAAPAEVKWLTGAEYVKRFDYPGDRLFTKVFCSILSRAFFLDTISSGETGHLGTKRGFPRQGAKALWNEHITIHSSRRVRPSAEFNR